jgi:hypothetical protein
MRKNHGWVFVEWVKATARNNAQSLLIALCPCADKKPFEMKLRTAFRAATACKIKKIVDSQQHERLKASDYNLQISIHYQQVQRNCSVFSSSN